MTDQQTNEQPVPPSALREHWDKYGGKYILIGFGFLLGVAVAKPSKKKKTKQDDLVIDNVTIYITPNE